MVKDHQLVSTPKLQAVAGYAQCLGWRDGFTGDGFIQIEIS